MTLFGRKVVLTSTALCVLILLGSGAAPVAGRFTWFLEGSQGDVWDAQWDMFLVLVGAIVAVVAFTGAHDRSIARLSSTT
jgi:uncharacterized membrane protein YjdF